MIDSVVENLVLDLLEWLIRTDRSYDAAIDAWRTSCPKLPVWEDANDRGLITIELVDDESVVRVTTAGFALLAEAGRKQQLSSRRSERSGNPGIPAP